MLGFIAALGPVFIARLGPPNVAATVTAVAVRATEVSLSATEVAIAATNAAIYGTPTPGAGEPTANEPDGTAPVDLEASRQAGSGDLSWDGLKIEVVSVNRNAWPLIKAQNQFNDPPLAGRLMLMVTIRVTNVEGSSDPPVQLTSSDFRLIGSRNEVYNTFSDETNCGVVPDEVDGVVARNSSMDGNICFQVPDQETEFTLIYERYSGDYPAVYFPLPEPR